MPAITLNSAPVNRTHHREEPVNQSGVREAVKYGAFALATVGVAAMLYSLAPSGPGPGPLPTPVKDFLKDRVAVPKLGPQIAGICPIADRYSEWTMMKLLADRVTYGVFYLKPQAQATSYETYRHPAGKGDFRYGISNGAQCERRDWLENSTDSLMHNLIEKSNGVFKFTRSTDYGSYHRLDITCTAKDDTLTCKGVVDQPKNPLHPTPLDRFSCDYTATETKSGSITETLKARGGDTVQETNTSPILLHQLLQLDLKKI